MTLNERSLEEIAEYIRAGRLSIAASMLAEAAPDRQLAGLALSRLVQAENLPDSDVDKLLAKLRRHGVDIRASDIPASAPGPMTVDMPPGWRDLETLGYITPVANLMSIQQKGILSFNRARRIEHVSIADPQIQDRRHHRPIQGRDLHDYVNLFINPRNAMLSRVVRERGVGNVCVVKVSAPAAFALPGVVVTARNAAAGRSAEVWPGARGLRHLDKSVVFADSWYVEGRVDRELKQGMMAEVLVPDSVPVALLAGVVVIHSETARKLRSQGVGLPIVSNEHLFFV